jgi:hypothetical protein
MPNILSPDAKNSNLKVASDVFTTVTAADVVASGLKNVTSVVVSFVDDPGDNPEFVSAVPGTNGNFTLKTWQNTTGTDPTPVAATTFGKKVAWIAMGY